MVYNVSDNKDLVEVSESGGIASGLNIIKKTFTFTGSLADDGQLFKLFLNNCNCEKFIGGKLFYKGSDKPDVLLDVSIDVKGIGKNNTYNEGEAYYILLDGFIGMGMAHGLIEILSDNSFDETTFLYGGGDSPVDLFITILNSKEMSGINLDLYFEQ